MPSQVLDDGFLRLPILLTAVEGGDVPRISSSIKRCPPAPPLPGRLVGRLCWTWSRLKAQTAGCLGVLAPASRHGLGLLPAPSSVFLVIGHRPWHCSEFCYLELSVPSAQPGSGLMTLCVGGNGWAWEALLSVRIQYP